MTHPPGHQPGPPGGAHGLILTEQQVQTLFPWHIALDAEGAITGLGNSLTGLLGEATHGQSFFEVFTVIKPRRIREHADILDHVGKRISLSVKTGAPDLKLRAVAIQSGTEGALFLDAAIAGNIAETISSGKLTSDDFRANDPTIDLITSLEAQRTLLDDAQNLARDLADAHKAAELRAESDDATGLANRQGLEKYLAELRAGHPGPFALLHIDLDKFKTVNDTFGHDAGDCVLRHVADAIRASAEGVGMGGRIGGDEFALLLDTGADLDRTMTCARQLIDRICKPVTYAGQICKVGASIGVLQFGANPDETLGRLLAKSDIALYEAKTKGNSAVAVTDAMVAQHTGQLALIGELRDSVAAEHFIPFFQPQVDTMTGDVSGLEVLARWRHPLGGIRGPDRFLSAASNALLMPEIDRQVRKLAMREVAALMADGLFRGRLSLNVTAASLLDQNMIEDLLDDLFEAGLSAENLRLELLESILFETGDGLAAQQSKRLKDAGFALALDDFGTGHASIATLLSAPISLLKIDRAFVSGIDRNTTLQRVTGSIIAMSDQLGLGVLAEGVETAAELSVLRRFGCHLFQGYHFSRPLDAAGLRDWLEHWRSTGGAEIARRA